MALKKFFEFYQHQGFKVVDPFLIPIPSKQFKLPRVVNEDEYQKLLSIIPRNNDPRHIRNRAIINMLWDTGARNGEIMSLNVEQINTKEKKAIILTEKSQGLKPVRQLMWTEETNDNLIKWLAKRKHLEKRFPFEEPNALFISVVSHQIGKRFSIRGVGEMLRRYSNRAQIPYTNAHSYRHHFGHELAKKGANNSIISNLMGHSSLQSSFTYTLLSGQEMEQEYTKFKRPAPAMA